MDNKEKFMQKTIVVWFGAFFCCLLWGSAFPCIKIGYRLFDIPADGTATQILFAGIRFTFAGIIALILGSLMNKKFLLPKKSSLGNVVKLSMLQTVIQYIFFYVGLANTTGVKASVIEGVSAFVAILVASLLFKQEKLTSRKIIGCTIGFIGVVLVNVSGNSMDLSVSFIGEGFILISTVAYAFSSIYIKRYSESENPVVLSSWQFIVGGVIMVICGLVAGGRIEKWTPSGVAMLLYLATVSAVAYSLWGILLKYNPVSKVAVFGFMNPVFGVILSAILLREEGSLSLISIVSLVLVCIGIYIVNAGKKAE
jgi:drug/metabolite transporter (DMT)-like permease